MFKIINYVGKNNNVFFNVKFANEGIVMSAFKINYVKYIILHKFTKILCKYKY